MSRLANSRSSLKKAHHASEYELINDLVNTADISPRTHDQVNANAVKLVKAMRSDSHPGLMEVFLAEYGLSSDEGVALMCLAEALLRVPDAETIDDLIEDKIAPSSWSEHLGKSSSSLVNASTWGLMLTGKILDDKKSMAPTLKKVIKRLGEPFIRTAVKQAMKEMGRQFVLGESINNAMQRARKHEDKGYTYSYDMLGEAALTENDAKKYFNAYRDSITEIAKQVKSGDPRKNPGISIKLSALHPRYEISQQQRVITELVESTSTLAKQARHANIGLNIDAEESYRLDLSLDVIEKVLSDPELAGWDGFGVVVQAYSKRAGYVLDWLYALAEKLDRKIMVRLVKGAYWDTEIKRSQVEGLQSFPVFTHKQFTDVSYICCSKKLLGMTDRIYPQFATHNAHSVAAIVEMATDNSQFEFQRLHGMGESLYEQVRKNSNVHCRIYAPVGPHKDLLAYLVRRLLENGANSSFVNQIVDEAIPPSDVVADPFLLINEQVENKAVIKPCDLYVDERPNSMGWDLLNFEDIGDIDLAREPFRYKTWRAQPIIAGEVTANEIIEVLNPADPGDHVGDVVFCTENDVQTTLNTIRPWNVSAAERESVLTEVSNLYEQNFGELFAVLIREAGKTPKDAIAELREAVDFLRYYAKRGVEQPQPCRGVFACISPWNFPLAIFTGQVSAALAAGNGVLAKPAESTVICASIAVKLMHQAGVPVESLQLLPGLGSTVGAKLCSDSRINGVCFTGSTPTAQLINKTMAKNVEPTAPLIAETGGINAMIVDSTALPEQSIRDIIASAFQSAGQRCSALRVLYLQEDTAEKFLEMLYGAMDELVVGDPWDYSTDVGPVINETARASVDEYIESARQESRLLRQLSIPDSGTFVRPTVIKVAGIQDLSREIFGPVLHVATFKSHELNSIIDSINGSGYGLTFGIHSRIDDRVEQVTTQLNVGNIYVNRNQIGAIVGSQPFGGEAMSGTGPKAGGPNYVPRFTRAQRESTNVTLQGNVSLKQIQDAINSAKITSPQKLNSTLLPGPTGESNQLSEFGRGVILCLGPTNSMANNQAKIVRENGCAALIVVPDAIAANSVNGHLPREYLALLDGFDAIALWSDDEDLQQVRQQLASRQGRLIPLVADYSLASYCRLERHICIDTTAAGGNTSLLAQAS